MEEEIQKQETTSNGVETNSPLLFPAKENVDIAASLNIQPPNTFVQTTKEFDEMTVYVKALLKKQKRLKEHVTILNTMKEHALKEPFQWMEDLMNKKVVLPKRDESSITAPSIEWEKFKTVENSTSTSSKENLDSQSPSVSSPSPNATATSSPSSEPQSAGEKENVMKEESMKEEEEEEEEEESEEEEDDEDFELKSPRKSKLKTTRKRKLEKRKMVKPKPKKPKIEKRKTKKPKIEKRKMEESKKESIIEKPITEKPITEKPIIEKPKTEQPKKEKQKKAKKSEPTEPPKEGDIVRGKLYTSGKPVTFNQLWTEEEQKRLEELLKIYPDEPISANRWKKIAAKLGTRTPKQVASRAQKYFNRLNKEKMAALSKQSSPEPKPNRPPAPPPKKRPREEIPKKGNSEEEEEEEELDDETVIQQIQDESTRALLMDPNLKNTEEAKKILALLKLKLKEKQKKLKTEKSKTENITTVPPQSGTQPNQTVHQ